VLYIAVVGGGDASDDDVAVAEAVGRGLAQRGAIVVCGGLGGVMEGACRGAAEAGGTSVALLPGSDRGDANRWATVVIPTGLGEARNAIVARAADAVIAIGGELGTLSEIALALRRGTPVVGYRTWELATRAGPFDGIDRVDSAEEAVELALALAATRTGSG